MGAPTVAHIPHLRGRYFNRDVQCIRKFFLKRYRYESALYPKFSSTIKSGGDEGEGFRLDVVVAASGFKNSEQEILENVGRFTILLNIPLIILWIFST